MWCDGRKDHNKVHCYSSYTLHVLLRLGRAVSLHRRPDAAQLLLPTLRVRYPRARAGVNSSPPRQLRNAHTDRAYVQYICQGLRGQDQTSKSVFIADGVRQGNYWTLLQYPYTADLMLLNFCSPPHGYAIPELEQVSTPLHPDS